MATSKKVDAAELDRMLAELDDIERRLKSLRVQVNAAKRAKKARREATNVG